MASINTVLNLLESGDHVVTGNDVYGGTHRLFTQVYEEYDLEFSFVDMTDLEAIESAFQENTELLWLETPTNPLLSIVDIEGAARSPTHTTRCVRLITRSRRHIFSNRSSWARISSRTH